MENFLEQSADYLISNYINNLHELCIVLPNRRAGLFLKRFLIKKIDKTFWSPEIFSTEDFFSTLSDNELANDITIYFKFYKLYKNETNDDAESFDEFLKWAPVLLNDFNEIDNYLVNANDLFDYLSEAKAIEIWSPDKNELTEFQKKYLKFWKLIPLFYNNLKNDLLSENIAYEGLQHRIIAENIIEKIKNKNWKKVVFIGFNALNKTEENLIKTLLSLDLAEIIWDADSYYVNNKYHEAGDFLRVYQNAFNKNSNFKLNNYFKESEKNITIIGVAQNVGQAKIAGELIKEYNFDIEKTAVILADENLLFPVLNSIPSTAEDINITMGYPLKNSPIHSLIELVFILHENAINFSKLTSSNLYRYYYSDIIKILNHPYLNYSDDIKKVLKKIADNIVNNNKIYISFSELESTLDIFEKTIIEDVFFIIFQKWNSFSDGILSLEKLINHIKNNLNNTKSNIIEKEFLFSFFKLIKNLKTQINEFENIKNIRTFHNIFNQIVGYTKLPFYGEPLKGLQIMGMLETRNLDFENIILLSVNEGILPASKNENSFIPIDIKRKFGLPTYKDKDSIFSYHFFRLLQRAKNIYIIHNNDNEGFGKGEKSRFITQLEYELPKLNSNIKIENRIFQNEISFSSITPISIEKSESCIEQLNKIAKKGISPTMLSTYVNCTLQFYYKYVAEIKEPEEITESIEANVFGSVIHEVLEKIYFPFIDKIVSSEELKKSTILIETLVEKAFNNQKITDLKVGKSLLISKVAIKFIKNYISKEIKTIENLEKNKQFLKII